MDKAWNEKRISQLQRHHMRVKSLQKMRKIDRISDAMKNFMEKLMPQIEALRIYCAPNESPCFTTHANRQNLRTLHIEIGEGSVVIRQSGTELTEWLAAGFPNVRHLKLHIYGNVHLYDLLTAINLGFASLERLEIVCGYEAKFFETSNAEICTQLASICTKNASTIQLIDISGDQFQEAILQALQYAPESTDFDAIQSRCVALFRVPLSGLKILHCNFWEMIMCGVVDPAADLSSAYQHYDALYELCFPSLDAKLPTLQEICGHSRPKMDNPAKLAWLGRKTLNNVESTHGKLPAQLKALLASVVDLLTHVDDESCQESLPKLKEALQSS